VTRVIWLDRALNADLLVRTTAGLQPSSVTRLLSRDHRGTWCARRFTDAATARSIAYAAGSRTVPDT